MDKISEQTIDKMIDIYVNEKKSISEICRKVKVSHRIARKYLRLNNIKIRNKFAPLKLNKDFVEKIIYLYVEKKMSCKKISNELQMSSSTVEAYLKKNKIKLRTLSEANRKYDINEDFFDNIDNEEKAYAFGLFYSDGCNTGKRIEIGLQSKDIDILQKINKAMGSNRPILITNYNNHERATLSFSNKKLCKVMNKAGCTERKSKTIMFPKIKQDLYRHFIRGFFDGDGCFHVSKRALKNGKFIFIGNIIFTCASNKFLDKLEEVFSEELNINSYRRKINLSFGGNRVAFKFLNWIYDDATIYLNRKHDKYINFKNSTKLRRTVSDSDLNYISSEYFKRNKSIAEIADVLKFAKCTIRRKVNMMENLSK